MIRAGGEGTPKTAGEAVQAQDVILRDAGERPGAVAEVVRSMTGLEPAAVKELMARVPCAIRTRISPALAEALRVKLVAAGGSVEVRTHVPPPELFDVFLRGHGAGKINVIRAVKMLLGLDLREAIELVDEAPCTLKRKIDRDEAETYRHELVEAGAEFEIRDHDPATPEPPARATARVEAIAAASARASVTTGASGGTASGLYEVILQQCGPNKISVIKTIRAATGLGLKESKDLAESTGAPVKRDLPAHEAMALQRELAAVGAVVEVRAQGGAAAEPAAEAAEDGPALVDVFLRSHGPNKILVIKEVRALTGLGLREVKDLVEAAPRMIKEKVDRDAARQLQHVLEEAGAVVELR